MTCLQGKIFEGHFRRHCIEPFEHPQHVSTRESGLDSSIGVAEGISLHVGRMLGTGKNVRYSIGLLKSLSLTMVPFLIYCHCSSHRELLYEEMLQYLNLYP